MPTGYTAYIENGEITKGKDFLLKCARAFGACIDLKEENLSVEIPVEFKPNTYHKERLKDAYIDLEKYKKMTVEEAQKIIKESYEASQENCTDSIEKAEIIAERYANIRKDVCDWVPPTSEYENLKKFALEQIDMSACADCVDYYRKELNKPKQTPEEYIQNMIERAADNIKYHSKGWNEEVKRTNERNKWINDLRESLKMK